MGGAGGGAAKLMILCISNLDAASASKTPSDCDCHSHPSDPWYCRGIVRHIKRPHTIIADRSSVEDQEGCGWTFRSSSGSPSLVVGLGVWVARAVQRWVDSEVQNPGIRSPAIKQHIHLTHGHQSIMERHANVHPQTCHRLYSAPPPPPPSPHRQLACTGAARPRRGRHA